MSSSLAGLLQVGVLLVLLAAVYVPFGTYMAGVSPCPRTGGWSACPTASSGSTPRASSVTELNVAIAQARG